MKLFMAFLPLLWIIGVIAIIARFLYRAWRSASDAKRRFEQANQEDA